MIKRLRKHIPVRRGIVQNGLEMLLWFGKNLKLQQHQETIKRHEHKIRIQAEMGWEFEV